MSARPHLLVCHGHYQHPLVSLFTHVAGGHESRWAQGRISPPISCLLIFTAVKCLYRYHAGRISPPPLSPYFHSCCSGATRARGSRDASPHRPELLTLVAVRGGHRAYWLKDASPTALIFTLVVRGGHESTCHDASPTALIFTPCCSEGVSRAHWLKDAFPTALSSPMLQ
jgi:hypothetical protein